MSDKLLNTAEAARFLRVSQASVRRWSDSGLLQARRVGRRGERRFREADLTGFLSRDDSSSPRRRAAGPDGVVIGGIHVSPRSHLATFYSSDESRLRLTIPFLRDGLASGEPCFLIAEGAVLNAYLKALHGQGGIDVDGAIRDHKLLTAPRPGNSVEGALCFWERVLTRALVGGPTLMRVVGEMSSALKGFESDSQMIDFEVAMNTITKRLPVSYTHLTLPTKA